MEYEGEVMAVPHSIRHVKFGDNKCGVEVTYGELKNIGDKQYSYAFTYENDEELNNKLSMAEREYLEDKYK